MSENIDSSITKIYEQQQTMNGTEEEALEYLQVLEQHSDLNVVIEEKTDTPIKISSKSWDKIIRLMPEEKKYSLAFICFSLIDEIEENEIWGIRKNPETGEEVVLQDVFFNTVLEASTPHELPFVMCEDDFSQFTDYFNQKEKEAKNTKIKLSEDLGLGEEQLENIDKQKEIQQQKEKEREQEPAYEIKTEVIEDKNGVTRLVQTKILTSHETVIEPKISVDTNKDEKEKVIIIPPRKTEATVKSEEKPKEEKKIEVSKPAEKLLSDLIKPEERGEPQTQVKTSKKIIINDNGVEKIPSLTKKEIQEKPELEKEELPNEEVKYKMITVGSKRNPQTKVIKKVKTISKLGKVKENEEPVSHDVIIYVPIEEEKPTTKIIRKKIVLKDGKDEEVEEDPGKNVIYKTVKFGHYRTPQTKIIRKRTIDDNGKDKEIEEDIPGDEVIVK